MFRPLYYRLFLGSLFAAFCVITGCGKAAPKTYEVSGTLTHNGTPLPSLQIVFLPENTGQFKESFGMTDAQGKFVMMYTPTIKGVAPGANTVYVQDPGAMMGGEPSANPAVVAVLKKYGDPRTSPMKLNVDAALKNYELKLD